MASLFSQRLKWTIGSGLGIAILLAVPGSPAWTQSPEDDIGAIQNLNLIWEEAYGAGDMDALSVLYDEDSIVIPRHGTAHRGAADIIAYFQAGAGRFDVDIRLEEEEIIVYGDFAHTMGLFWVDASPKDGVEAAAFSDSGRYLILLKRAAGGTWKVFRDIDQHTLDAETEPAE